MFQFQSSGSWTKNHKEVNGFPTGGKGAGEHCSSGRRVGGEWVGPGYVSTVLSTVDLGEFSQEAEQRTESGY